MVMSPRSPGRPGTMGCADGQGSSARFNNPSRLAVDSKGDVYVVEYARAVRKITPGGIVTTIAGEPSEPGLVNGQIGEARFNALRGIAVDNSGIVYVVDTDVIRAISPDGVVVSTLSGKHRNSEGYVPDSYDNAVSPLLERQGLMHQMALRSIRRVRYMSRITALSAS